MNRIRALVISSFRGYRTNRGGRSSSRRTSGRPGEMTMPESEIFSKNFAVDDSEDVEDIDAFASDFQNVANYDRMHQSEIEIRKDKLKMQIVKRKYFRSEDPSMLTWAEKEQIRLLYAEDPVLWSEDRLCESFPVTREAVLRVLRSKWSPKSVKIVTRYDEAVMKNWDLYKSGKLVVSDELRVHLAKFKDRKIEPMDPGEIARMLIKPKPVFPKPKSTIFSGIIQSYLDANPSIGADDADSDDEMPKKTVEQITSGESVRNDSRALKLTARLEKLERQKTHTEPLTFDEFLKHRVENVDERKITPVDRVLIDEYKERKNESYGAKSLIVEEGEITEEAKIERRTDRRKAKGLIFQSESPVGSSGELEKMRERLEKTFSECREETKEKELTKVDWNTAKKTEDAELVGFDAGTRSDEIQAAERKCEGLTIDDRGRMDTGIVARHKKNDPLHEDYPDCIKIPSKKYRQGVTYRVNDRYYDDDGEFLYRTVGMKS